MGIQITYKDAVTGNIIKTVTLTDEEIKALETDMADIIEWHENTIRQKARRMIDAVVEQALKPGLNLLTKDDKMVIQNKLIETGQFITRVRDIPDDIKREIVKRARVKKATAEPEIVK